MSLINKMLQDIDARAGQPGAAPLPGDVRPVLAPERRSPVLRVALLGGGLLAAVAAVAGWKMLQTAPAPVVVAAAPAVAPAPAPAPTAVVVAMPAAAPVQVADVDRKSVV